MSKYKLITGEEIEMNNLTEISYIGGWSGGCYNFKVKESLDKRFFVYVLSIHTIMELPKPKLVEMTGTDYDHGHNYAWKRDDLQFKISTQYGFDSTFTLYDIVTQFKQKVWMM
ncbi:hypothetical protein SHAb15599_00133 [Acinetobacter phage SH-Ab 15599]|nr:hypothetical protein SHAb15599_00133 [Acinetobacter phage SH-Ab 15599]